MNGYTDNKSKLYKKALKTNKNMATAVKKVKMKKNKMSVVLPKAKKKQSMKVLASYSLDADSKEKLTKLARKQGYNSTSNFLNDLIKNL